MKAVEQEILQNEEIYVILGNGAAGFHAAREIRERDKKGSIFLISSEPYPTYHRPMLTKSMATKQTALDMGVAEPAWYEEHRITQLLGREVQKVDAGERMVWLSDGEKLPYTKLIYALGAECSLPPVPGIGRREVIAIRRMSDVEKLREQLGDAKRAVVIGGGVLGLEAAWELKKAGLEVTVLEAAPKLMGRQLDDHAGELVRSIVESCGIGIHTGASVAAIEGEARVTGVRLEDGICYPADLVIVSAGISPNVSLAKEMGLKLGRGVLVNRRMETSLPGVYACGDCAEYEGAGCGLWLQASRQGKVAGANASGESMEYRTVPAGLAFRGMGTSLYAVGDNGKNPDRSYRTAEFRDDEGNQYEKYYFLDDRLCGAILIGNTEKMARVMQAVEKKKTFQEMFG